ncbi:MAG: diaminopimelate decarboxylase family protein [Peptoanaerobacter stomatis]|uniref:diaminopimelate decarboxylase family protein n=1 Tax=Peptoanaerobacter stomatis TaxID=796937 RepID=UPI003F9F2F90
MITNDIIIEQSKKYDSFYLYDEEAIINNINRLKNNFVGVDFLYSVKCNPHTLVLDTIFKNKIGSDAASLNEVLISKEKGVSKENIYYSAPGKNRKSIEQSIDIAVIIADSLSEIELIDEIARNKGIVVNIGVRINPDFSFTGDFGGSSKFGIDEEQFIEKVPSLKEKKNIKITGIHAHVKSQELEKNNLVNYYKRMFKLSEKIQNVLGYELDFINLGSGIGITYSPDDVEIDIESLAKETVGIIKSYKEKFKNTRIFIETGRYLVGKNGIYATKVLDKKLSRKKKYVILSNTLNGFVRPSMSKTVMKYASSSPMPYEPFFTCEDAFQFKALTDRSDIETVNLVGNLCTAIDVIAEDINLPVLEKDDVIVITNAGAYASVLTPMQFSSQEKPPELFLNTKNEVIE